MDPIVLSSLITAIATVLSGVLGVAYVKKRRLANEVTEELSQSINGLSFAVFMHQWSAIHDEVRELFEDTEIDRFLILRAWNGKHAPLWTTAVFQLREGEQETTSYVHTPLDADYVSRLKMMQTAGIHYMTTKDAEKTLIYDIYSAEGVHASVWAHIHHHQFEDGKASHTYCSFATHSEEGISKTTQTRCRLLAGRLQGMAEVFDSCC